MLVKDLDRSSPDDLIDIIFACSAYETDASRYSHPRTFMGALRIASITLSFRVRCTVSDNCDNALQPVTISVSDGNGMFLQC